MSGGGSDWSDSLFKPEKGDALGDGSWGRESDEPDLAPVAWDKLPQAPDKSKARARLATPAPGSNKESGLLDIKHLAPDLMKGNAADASDAPPEPAASSAKESAIEALSKTPGPLNEGSLSSSLVDQPVVPMPKEDLEPSPDIAPKSGNGLLVLMGLLALVVAGLAAYVFTR